MWICLAIACTRGSSVPAALEDPRLEDAGTPDPVLAPPALSPTAPPIVAIPEGAFHQTLAPGLELSAHLPPPIADPGYRRAPAESLVGTEPRIFVVLVDPDQYEVVYLSTLDPAVTGPDRTASDWAGDHGLHVAFNPGMFEPDGRATGYTRAGSFVSQPAVRGQPLYRSWFAVGSTLEVLDQRPPKGAGHYGSFDGLAGPFRTRLGAARIVSQSLAILRDGQPAYPPRKTQWSELAYGTHRDGRLAIVFSRHPYEMREFGARVAALDLGIDALIHGEGGPESTLVVRAGGVDLVQVGSYETGFSDDSNHTLWTLPAVMGVRPRSTP